MKLVVDSSVVLKWFVDEPGREAAAAILDGDDVLLAPDLLLAEIANSLWRKVRLEQIEAVQAAWAIREASALMTLRPVTATLTQTAFEMAQELGHSIYDCLFLAHARDEKADLVTADLKFAAKLAGRNTGVHVRVLEP